MTQWTLLHSLTRVAGVVGAIAVAAVNLGASDYDYAPIAKDDRAASVADCRDPEFASSASCAGIDLPQTATETYMVMPGLTVVEQVGG